MTLVFLAFLFNNISLEIRLKELVINLQQINRTDYNDDHIHLISQYSFHHKLYSGQINREKADKVEFRLQQILSEEKNYSSVLFSNLNFISRPAVFLINLNRKIIGKPPIKDIKEFKLSSDELDKAFYYERNFIFGKAVKSYDSLLKSRHFDPSIEGSILLHKGFCIALSGKIPEAKSIFHEIIKKFHGENTAITASVLLGFVEKSVREKDKVLLSSDSPIVKAEKLHHLSIFNESMKIIKTLEKNPRHTKNPRFMALRALSYSSIGLTEKAANIFLDLIEINPSSKYARFANRRLFLIGVKTKNDSFMKAAQRLNLHLKDPLLTNMLSLEKYRWGTQYQVQGKISISLPLVRIEKLEGQLSNKKQSAIGKILIIQTNSGDTLIGSVVDDTTQMFVLKTSIGVIEIEKKGIKSIKEKN